MLEIERKFLVVSSAYKAAATRHTTITQGFLNTAPERTVRIRLQEDQGFLTVKGKSNTSGTTRLEWETQMPAADAERLLTLCESGILKKTRYEVPVGAHCYEVDEFHGENNGLVVAEIELQTEEEAFEKPKWLGKEVTGDVRYYNSQLSKNPFKNWK